jgi:branched-chain amino acid transport system substrate-binding protein
MKVSLKDATDVKSARQATVDALADVSFEGVTGTVEFDEYGDTLAKTITGYKVDGGKWVSVKSETMS